MLLGQARSMNTYHRKQSIFDEGVKDAKLIYDKLKLILVILDIYHV